MRDTVFSKKRNDSYEQVTTRVSSVSMAGNVLLAAFKFFAGIFGHSAAMISDAVHSSSDVLGSLIVLIGVKLSGKEADRNHPYGHERFESVASILLSFLLLMAGLEIAGSSIGSVVRGEYLTAQLPGKLFIKSDGVSTNEEGLITVRGDTDISVPELFQTTTVDPVFLIYQE